MTSRIIPLFFVVSVAMMSGCATKGVKGVKGVNDHIYGYALTGVEVIASEDAYTGIFDRIDDLDDAEFAKQVEEKLEAVMTEVLTPSFSGGSAALIVTHVDEMNIASGFGRAVGGNSSFIGAQVRVIDASTRVVIAERHFRVQENKGDSSDAQLVHVLTLFISKIAENIIDAVANDEIEEVAREFTEEVKKWLDH